MNKRLACLLGAVAAVGALGSAQAAPLQLHEPSGVLQANSFAELLEPIANAAETLRAIDQAGAPGEAIVEQAQYYDDDRFRYRHHHHHHHHAYYRRYYEPEVVIVPRYRRPWYHHHHHHHHHHNFYRRDYW